MEKETDKKYKVMKTIMDALENILCSYQGRGHLSVYTDLDSLALFASLVAYGQIQVEDYQYDYDDGIREDGEAVRIYQELVPQTRWRVGQRTQIEAIRMNALKQFAGMGTPVFEEQIYYKDTTASVLVCGEILPYEVFQLFTDVAEVKKLYVFPYPFRDRWERLLYFSFEPTEAALEEMRKYMEKKWEEMYRTIRENDKSFDAVIPKVEKWEG
mgnify:CR=1 FL=1